MDSGSLLKAIMGPVEVKILLSLGGWLSHGQSCHISYFYIYKGTSTDAKVKKLIHLGKEFQRRRLLNVSTNQKQESSMAIIFLSDPVNMRKLHKTHFIDAPNQILIH